MFDRVLNIFLKSCDKKPRKCQIQPLFEDTDSSLDLNWVK